MNLKSSANKQGKVVTEIIHFSDGSKKTIEGILTETIRQGQFTQFMLTDGRLIYINDRNVNMIEVFKGGEK
jgi:hypothetical protein